jgi:hypothetical protein
MNRYRCVFHYANGHTTVVCDSVDASAALLHAKALASTQDVRRIEIWEGAVCVKVAPQAPERAALAQS